MIVKKIFRCVKTLWAINWSKTFYVNWALLPLSSALHFPILIFGHAEICIRRSRCILTTPPHFGMILWGKNKDCMLSSHEESLLLILDSTIKIGDHCSFGPHSTLRVQNGILEIGDYAGFGGGTKILCFHRIRIGNNLACGFETIFYDSNSHYVKLSDGTIPFKHGDIVVGNDVWIGNNVTVFRNSHIPDYCIVGQRALVNKDFSSASKGSLLVGIPAKVKTMGMYYIDDRRNRQKVSMLDRYYKEHTEVYNTQYEV